MDVITHFLIPYIILTVIRSKNRLAGAFGGISLDFDTIFVAPLDNIFVALTGILAPQLFILAHRGITHSFIFALITSTIFLYILSRKQVNKFISNIIRRDISVEFTKTTIGIAYFGALTHLFLDLLTTKGIPLLYPFSITKYAAEIYPAINIIITIVAVIVLIVLYLRVNENYKKTAMALFMITLVSFGCIMTYEKFNALEAETATLNGNYSQIAAYPTQNMFVWTIVEHDAENKSYKVSEYNTLNNQESNIKTYRNSLIENGSYSSAQNAINITNSRLDVQKFKFNSYYTLVSAKYNSGKWSIIYYDILSSWTERSLTVSIPSK